MASRDSTAQMPLATSHPDSVPGQSASLPQGIPAWSLPSPASWAQYRTVESNSSSRSRPSWPRKLEIPEAQPWTASFRLLMARMRSSMKVVAHCGMPQSASSTSLFSTISCSDTWYKSYSQQAVASSCPLQQGSFANSSGDVSMSYWQNRASAMERFTRSEMARSLAACTQVSRGAAALRESMVYCAGRIAPTPCAVSTFDTWSSTIALWDRKLS
mmetsp:Transcript_34172/g.96294  ORF Transcript_34172/g.96294 Transcript_34172/m.96294 type:complete len:215 (-) Transcript_34172:1756-2400(-)